MTVKGTRFMRKDLTTRLLMPLATLAAALSTAGFVAPSHHEEGLESSVAPGFRVVRPALTESSAESLSPFGADVRVKVDARSGAPRLITGDLLPGTTLDATREGAATFIAAAERFIALHAEALGVAPADLRVNRGGTQILGDFQTVRFDVLRGGLPVRDADVHARFKFGRLVQVASHTYGEAGIDSRADKGDLDRAARVATLATEVKRLGDVYRVAATDGGYRLVRVTEFQAKGQDGRPSIVSIAAATGEVHELRPTTFYLEGTATGSVYPRYYKDSPETFGYRELTLAYEGGSVLTDASGRFTGAPNDAEPSLKGFTGERVQVVTATGDQAEAKGAAKGNRWEVTFRAGASRAPEDKSMAQSMTYFHLNKEINFAKQFINNSWLDQQLTANVNLDQHCNAYWDGSSVNLFSAGDGCANTALISDVFYHEWGHGLHANSGGIQDGAYSEGFGDTMALMMTHSPILGIGFRTANGKPVRDMRTLKVYPDDADSEVHQEGIIIGGAYYDLFEGLKTAHGEEQAGKLLAGFALKAISTTTRYTDVYDALLVIDGKAPGAEASANFCIINKAFARHGLAKADASCT